MFGRRTPTPAEASAASTMLARRSDAPADLGGEEPVWLPQKLAARRDVESLLRERGLVSEEQIAQARAVQNQTPGRPLGQILVTMNAVTEAQLLSVTASLLGVPFEVPERASVDAQAFGMLPTEYVRKQAILPLRIEDRALVVGMADPNNIFLVDEIRRRVRRDVKPVAVPAGEISKLFEQLTAQETDVKVDEIIKDMSDDDVQVVKEAKDDVTDLEKLGSESPVIRFVNYLVFDAIKQGASDIHIEPKEKALKVRYRIDGVLFEAMNPPHSMHAAIVSRLKIMANLDIAERRLPQDGRIRAVVHGRKVDLRMSTLPTVSGEKVVMRILDNKSISVTLDNLGFGQDQLSTWKDQIDQPHGILLVTGPTGSGKTTTLYASLGQMDAQKLNISTVEDPVEYHLSSVNQTQMHDRIGMTFAKALKALLRQDPDVVMLGEIRDGETATIAVQAALTGHLVLSTLHTNDAPSSVTRLINIGVEPYLIAAAVNAILAQRLVRKICQHCKEPFTPGPEVREMLHKQGVRDDSLFHGRGCDRCRKTGYAGRLGIYEMLVLDDPLRDLVTKNMDVIELRRACRERGLVNLREDGFRKVMNGLTTVDEILRVTEAG